MCVVAYMTSPISNNSSSSKLNSESLLDLVTLLVTAPRRHRTSDVFWTSILQRRLPLPAWGFRHPRLPRFSPPRGQKMQQIITCTRSAGATVASNPAPTAPGHPESAACMPLRRQAPRDMRGWEDGRHPRDVPTFWNEWRRAHVRGRN